MLFDYFKPVSFFIMDLSKQIKRLNNHNNTVCKFDRCAKFEGNIFNYNVHEMIWLRVKLALSKNK